jgi:3',5'-cyclic AMP phosphodiesterase CpdA
MLHAGDLINRAQDDALWGEWFSAGSWLNAMTPVIPAVGNHEYFGRKRPDGSFDHRLSRHWRAQFTLPENGPPGLEETAYYIDYQQARIIVLNSNVQLEEQAQWLERILSDNPNSWTIITFHHPIFALTKDRLSRTRGPWKPVFDRHHVDLVLTGHDHIYARTSLVKPDQPASTSNGTAGGTVYIVSVSGSKMYLLDPSPDEPAGLVRRVAEDTQLYQVISIDGQILSYEARTATGARYDAFVLKKRPDGTNELIDKPPQLPERRRPKPEPGRSPNQP